ncbi:MAG: DUF4919 domain-containing protein [Micavibrio sp.]|nr:DUF4919 domain-containing protein [Micavibrio sp.]
MKLFPILSFTSCAAVAFVVASLFVSAPARAEFKDQEYLAQVAKVRANPAMASEWATLRALYIQTSFYDPYGGAQAIWYGLQRIGQQMVANPTSTELQKSYDEMQTRHYAHYRSHLQAIDLGEKNNVPHINLKEQYDSFKNVMSAIMTTGDGKTPETAYHVIDPAEEQMVMKIKRLQPIGQDFRQKDGHFWDVQVYGDPRDKDKKEEVFFNVDDILRSGAGKRSGN